MVGITGKPPIKIKIFSDGFGFFFKTQPKNKYRT